ncbi:MAG: 4-diphosphocytidyl-2-C-methyl-D-erythritol kinase [Acetothermia bacterium 64_32]|nr:MAG: 4-diphosphocytidyl-2-C-methyl-D-erythritol kinase [Acetothermia bacterium 64_32]HAF70592.1 4-(cytidine 5'-diphospho)-2-C-methyl-D-erythritol kinase [Candidatus Acetothermia bacterium]
MADVRVLAYAKLNLILKVVGRREDGYHLLQSLMCAVDLYDELFLVLAGDLTVEVEGLDIPPEDNLVLRAARLLRDRVGTGKGAHIRVIKRIPVGAGLGGGSSDTAAALAGLNRLWGLGLSRAALQEVGLKLGADVPFFLGESPAWAEGVGERLSPAQVKLPGAFLILVPPFSCSTPEVYRLYDELSLPPSCPLRLGGEIRFDNDLWPAAVRLRPELGRLRSRLEALTGLGVGMTGSGSALFCAFSSRDQAEKAAQSLKKTVEGKLFVAAPVPRGYKFAA